MITNVVEMYRYFLAGIKKEQTTIVPPSHFNILINEAQDLWYKEKAAEIELNQKRIDDLQVLRTVTDGQYSFGGVVLNPIGPITYDGLMFMLPDGVTPINNRWVGTPPNVIAPQQVYPRYRRLLSIEFRVRYIDDECGRTGESDWLPAYVLRSDQLVEIKKNPFRKPNYDRMYYYIENNIIRLVNGRDRGGIEMRLEYLRYPRVIFFDETGQNHVNSEFLPEQQKEIVDRAVLLFVERVKSERYKTLLNQELMRRYVE